MTLSLAHVMGKVRAKRKDYLVKITREQEQSEISVEEKTRKEIEKIHETALSELKSALNGMHVETMLIDSRSSHKPYVESRNSSPWMGSLSIGISQVEELLYFIKNLQYLDI